MLLLFCYNASSKAQELLFNVQYFNQDDGLSDRATYSINQDDRGIIWIGTQNGLNKFDGSQFSKVKNKASNIAAGNIIKLSKREDGLFWIQKVNDPIAVFDPLQERLLPLEKEWQDKLLEFFYNHELPEGHLAQDREQQLYITTNKGDIIPVGTSIYSGPPGLLAAGEQGLLIGNPDGGLVEINYSGDTIYQNEELYWSSRIIQPPGVEAVFSTLNDFYKKEFNDALVEEVLFQKISDEELIPLKLNIAGRPLRMEEVIFKYSHYVRIIKDFQNRFWLVSQNHVLLFDVEGNLLKDLSSELGRFSKSNWTANDLFIDRDNRLWIATGLGVFVIEIKNNPFQKYQVPYHDWSTRCIFELPEDKLFISTYHGARILNRTTREQIDSFSLFGLACTQRDSNSILIGMHGSTLLEYSPASGTLIENEVASNFENFLSAGVPHYDQSSATLFLGTNKGLFIQVGDRKDLYFKRISSDTFPEIDYLNIRCIYQNDQGLWIGTNKGIYQYQDAKGIHAHYTFPFNDIKHIYEDQQGDFWMATNGGGLLHWNPKTDEKLQYTTDDGLSHDVIYAVYQDSLGYLWLPSNNGLMRFDKTTKETIVFLPEDGITSKEFNTFSHYQAPDGRLYFGGLDGVIAFYPETIQVKRSNAPFVITSFQIFSGAEDQLLDQTQRILQDSAISMEPEDKFFVLDFAWLDFSSPEKNYAWRLNTETWNYQKENRIRINKLPYGNHRLEIKAKGAGGQWASQLINLPIIVQRPFYLKAPFVFFSILALGLLTWAFIAYRTANLKKRAQELSMEVFQRTQIIRVQKNQLEEANQFKDKILTLVAHDLRSPLLTLSGLSQKIKFLIEKGRIEDVKKLSDTVEHSVEGTSRLLDNIMNWALLQQEKVQMVSDNISIQQAIKNVVGLYRNQADSKNISIEYPEEDYFAYVDATALETILRNLLHNAIKFTPSGGKVRFHTEQQNGRAIIQIEDTGVGMKKEVVEQLFDFGRRHHSKGTQGEKGTGVGLSLVKELTERNGGDIRVSSKEGKGTIFYVDLPMDAAYFPQ